MIGLRALALVLTLVAGMTTARAQSAQASDRVGVEIVQYGLYRSEIVEKQAVPGGITHNVIDKICHIATTQSVPMKVGVHFGVRYRVTGPVRGERVLLTRVIRLPAVLTPPPPDRPMAVVSSLVELKVGTTTYAEYAFEQPWELAPGAWTFQFFERDRKLAEISFTVTEGAAVQESAEPTCFQLSS